MEIKLWINGKLFTDEIAADTTLLEYLRSKGCYSVKCGCETSNCGLCTVLLENKPILSCTALAAGLNGKHIVTLEGMQEEARMFGEFLADQGADQCGFCNPGFVLTVIAMSKELKNPSDDEINEYLSGNLCRCTGYAGQLRAIKAFLGKRKGGKLHEKC